MNGSFNNIRTRCEWDTRRGQTLLACRTQAHSVGLGAEVMNALERCAVSWSQRVLHSADGAPISPGSPQTLIAILHIPPPRT
eukprot:1124238-Prymnesium_polylepis.1